LALAKEEGASVAVLVVQEKATPRMGPAPQHTRRMLAALARAGPAWFKYYWPALPPRQRRGPGGRKGRPLKAFAEVAAAYVAAVEAGSKRPVVDVARVRKVPPSQVRDTIRRARLLGLLTTARHGVRGGSLTSQAKTLLRKMRQRTKPGRKGGH
jgi:hypothetical protein